jgi:hypothetical protein
MPTDPINVDDDDAFEYGWEDSIQHCTDHTLLDELADRLEQGGTIFAEEQGRELARLLSEHIRTPFRKGLQS